MSARQLVSSTGAHLVHPYDDLAVMAGQWSAAAELLDINHAGGQVVPGLTRRREAERDVFLG